MAMCKDVWFMDSGINVDPDLGENYQHYLNVKQKIKKIQQILNYLDMKFMIIFFLLEKKVLMHGYQLCAVAETSQHGVLKFNAVDMFEIVLVPGKYFPFAANQLVNSF